MFGKSQRHSPKSFTLNLNPFKAPFRAFYASKKMTIQTVNLGSAPTGAGGDTFRSTGAK